MNSKVNSVFNLCEDWNSKDLRRLISELEDLADRVEEIEEADEEMTLNSLDRF